MQQKSIHNNGWDIITKESQKKRNEMRKMFIIEKLRHLQIESNFSIYITHKREGYSLNLYFYDNNRSNFFSFSPLFFILFYYLFIPLLFM